MLSEEEIQTIQKIKELKRTFKTLGKNQLIDLLLGQIAIAAEQQNANKVLLADLNKLKAEKESKNE